MLASLTALQAQDNVTVDDVVTGKAEVKARQSITLSTGFHAVAGSDFHAYIDPSATSTIPTSTATSDVTVSGAPTSTGQNYIRSITLREPLSTMPTGNYAHMEEIRYFDGLGRPSQVIQVNASPGGNDIVQPIVYDSFGREAQKYLPYVAPDNNGAYVGNAATACETFYNTTGGIAGKDDDSKPYSFTDFEASPLNRAESQTGAGEEWYTNSKAVNYYYNTNTGVVNSWDENGAEVSYPINSLYVTQVSDEDDHITKEYKDKLGRVILKESVHPHILKTYYIYDDFGLLRTVVPPLADSPADTDLCYYYTYDGRKRMISKKIPGAEIVYMVYDKRDRLVLTQDGNLRTIADNGTTVTNTNRYLFTKYDQLNRPVMTGTLVATKSLDELRTDFKDYTDVMYEEYESGQNINSYGYTLNQSYPSSCDINASDILTVTWYDDYDFLSVVSNGSKMEFGDFIPDGTGYVSSASGKTKGVATGSMTKALPVANSGMTMANTQLVNVSYYDDYGNVIKSISLNHKNGFDVIHSKYEAITFQVLETQEKHTMPNQDDLVITKTFDYDHMGRLLETKCQVNEEDPVVMNAMRYNELGELVEKYLHSEDVSANENKAFVQKVDYHYNIRGWMTAINDPDLGEDNDLFGMKLYYNNLNGLTADRVTGGAQYNGNISAMVCSNLGDEVQTRGYGFNYDGLNRLTAALYGEGLDLASNKDKFNVGNISYDANGNIMSLQRTYNGTLADNLTYTYENTTGSVHKSNRLKKVSDPAGDIADMADYAVKSASDYSYDDNGNMTFDPGKGTAIRYNYLNLPQEVKISDTRKIFYHYDAAGNKLAKYIDDQGTYKTTEYIANLVYTDGQKSFFSTEEGRAIPIESNGTTRWHFEYNLKDHLGNTRVSFGGSNIPGGADIVQTSTYYPFGMVMAQNNYNTAGTHYQQNKYLYNGKEIQDDVLGGVRLDWYDYGARFYDASLGRWHVIDPLAEEPHNLSLTPYHYCNNNPILYIDVNGEDWFQNEKTGDVVFISSLMQGAEKSMTEGWVWMGNNDMFTSNNEDKDVYDVLDENSTLTENGVEQETKYNDRGDEYYSNSAYFKGDKAREFMKGQGYEFKPTQQVQYEKNAWYGIPLQNGPCLSVNFGADIYITEKSGYFLKGSVEKSTTPIGKALSDTKGVFMESVVRFQIEYTSNKFLVGLSKFDSYMQTAYGNRNSKSKTVHSSWIKYAGDVKLINEFMKGKLK